MRETDFSNLLRILDRKTPKRPTLFELFLNDTMYRKIAGPKIASMTDDLAPWRLRVHGMRGAGFDYASVLGSDLNFPAAQTRHMQTKSLNEGGVIFDRASFEAYAWMDPDKLDYSRLERLEGEMPRGMKLVVMCPGGVLENAIQLVGYERLCLMIIDDPQLAWDVFEAVGSRLVRYCDIACAYPSVGAAISNDDWGFKTQTMLSPADMRKYVIPWHKRIVAAMHKHNKPAILHSCGNLEEVMEDIIEDIAFDGKHSYEDAIMPVEDAYEKYAGRIAVLGGIDVDFICRRSVDEIRKRSRGMLERSAARGGYALGTGNSVPEYIPEEKFYAMTSTALEPGA
jgi:uroporphyrinogen decarboxylase